MVSPKSSLWPLKSGLRSSAAGHCDRGVDIDELQFQRYFTSAPGAMVTACSACIPGSRLGWCMCPARLGETVLALCIGSVARFKEPVNATFAPGTMEGPPESVTKTVPSTVLYWQSFVHIDEQGKAST